MLAAARDLKAGLLDALVTAPISKENTQADDFRFHEWNLTLDRGASSPQPEHERAVH